jgi:hypothetical protein
MSIDIIVPLKLNPIPSRTPSSTPPSLTSSSKLLWILEFLGREEGGGGCFLLKHAHGFALHPPPPFPFSFPSLPRIQETDRFALAWSVRSGSSIILRHPQYLQLHQHTRTPKLPLAPRLLSPAACTQLFHIPFTTRSSSVSLSLSHSLTLSPSQLKLLH